MLGLEPEGFADLLQQEFESVGGFGDDGYDDLGGFDDDLGDGFGDEEDDLLAALDAALDELEAEQRDEVREVAVPTNDAVEWHQTPQQMWVSVSQSFICTDKVPRRAPGHAKPNARGHRVMTQDPMLQNLLSNNLSRARMALDQRRSG